MRLSTLLPALLAGSAAAQAIKTSIYINEITGYSALAPCAINRVSAVVRAQASGCGDNRAHTSFRCFCIDQSSHMSSVLSTAVEEFCSSASSLTGSLTAPLPEATAAISVFDSYCARSTELAWYQGSSSVQATVTVTLGPSSTPAPSATPVPSSTPAPSTPISSSTATALSEPSSSSSKSVPVAAIAAPVVIGTLVIAAIAALLIFRRRRRRAVHSPDVVHEAPLHAPPTYTRGGDAQVQEMGEAVKYRSELDSQPVELEGGKGGVRR